LIMATADQLERQAALKAALNKVDWNSPFFKTADQKEREAKKKAEQAAVAAMYNKTNPSATLATGNIYKPAGSGSRSPDTMEASAAIKAGVPTIGSPKAPTLKQQLDAMTDQDWKNLGKLIESNKPKSTPSSSSSSSSTPATAAPVDTGTPSGSGSGGSGSGGSGGSGGEAAAPVSNVEATSQMFADALKALQAQYGVSQENINAAIARMQADPYNTANAYATMQLAPARVAADPLAQYMQAAGLSDQQSAAAAQLSQAEADAYRQAMQNVQNVMSKSQEQANLSRLADIGLISTGAQQDLEANLNMLRLGLERDRIGALTGLQQQNLQNSLDMRNAIANQISSIFSGQDVAPESILKLIEQALSKINTNRWTSFPAPMTGV
jgi:hypothetical protein